MGWMRSPSAPSSSRWSAAARHSRRRRPRCGPRWTTSRRASAPWRTGSPLQPALAYAPRDLEAMDHEVGQLAARQAQFEEEEIILLEEEEPLDVALAEHQTTLEVL